MRLNILSASTLLIVGGCAAQGPVEVPAGDRPIQVMPAGLDSAPVRADLIATARAKFGSAAVDRALANPVRLFVKRFAGMVPPPPPGSSPDWAPPTPTALLIKTGAGWMVATESGWRPANAEAVAKIESILGQSGFWTESAFTPACPDFGSGNLLLKTAGRLETVRIAQCISAAASLVDAALRA
jgi:hypothetical protein